MAKGMSGYARNNLPRGRRRRQGEDDSKQLKLREGRIFKSTQSSCNEASASNKEALE